MGEAHSEELAGLSEKWLLKVVLVHVSLPNAQSHQHLTCVVHCTPVGEEEGWGQRRGREEGKRGGEERRGREEGKRGGEERRGGERRGGELGKCNAMYMYMHNCTCTPNCTLLINVVTHACKYTYMYIHTMYMYMYLYTRF